MGDFDGIKVGVCDCYWTPPGSSTEIFLGLTKGGCELTYTPEWYDLQTDRYGKSSTDSALVGEKILVKVPLAETDIDKIEMFSHTGVSVTNGTKKKLTFGRFPGMRLSSKAGRLRLHPVSMGVDKSEDVVVYKAVNGSPLSLNYKLDEERIFSTEFSGFVNRKHINGALLWEIGDSTIGVSDIALSSTLDSDGLPSNLAAILVSNNSSIWVNPQISNLQSTVEPTLRTFRVKTFAEFNGEVFDVSAKVTYRGKVEGGVTYNGTVVCTNSENNLPTVKPVLTDPDQVVDAEDFVQTINLNAEKGCILIKAWTGVLDGDNLYKNVSNGANNELSDWAVVSTGDILDITLEAVWGSIVIPFNVKLQIVP